VPRYDYVCRDCGNSFDIRMSISAYSEGAAPSCPECGSDNATRSFAAVNVLTGSRSAGGAASGACGPSGFR
jgi:putative FmdB family regulatory protein